MTYIIGSTLVALVLFLVYLLGRKSHENLTLQKRIDQGDEVNEILQKQRDNSVSNVDDANKLWSELDDWFVYLPRRG